MYVDTKIVIRHWCAFMSNLTKGMLSVIGPFYMLHCFFCLGDQYVIESDGLVIQNVNRDNAGTYTCRARVPDTGELEERDIQLDVST